MNKRILVVDDEADILVTLQKRLEVKGYNVSTATSGHEALGLIRQARPDLIILDVMMPGMDGTDLAQSLRLDPLTEMIPIIFLTALQTKKDEAAGGPIISGEVVLAKPFEAKKLLSQVESLLGKTA